jgi:hypothetical protein
VNADRKEWLRRVGEATAPYRQQKAEAHERRAEALRRLRRVDPARVPETTPKWHEARAAGQRHRPTRVERCHETGILVRACQGCGVQSRRMLSCGSALLCSQCRTRTNKRLRARFSRSRDVAMRDVQRRGLLVGFARWSEKLITLTVPHEEAGASMSPGRRVELLRGAWTRLLRWLNRSGAFSARGAAWYRVTEWTPGSDGLGHPHIHLWAICPWIDRSRLLRAWRDALSACGYRWADEDAQPVIDVRSVRARNGRTDDAIALELLKYMTKDLDAGGLIDPELYALVYELFDGSRRTQGSSGFIARGQVERVVAPCSCGHVGCDAFVVAVGSESFNRHRDLIAVEQAARSRERALRLSSSLGGVA